MYNHCEVIEPLHLIEKMFGARVLLWIVLYGIPDPCPTRTYLL
jgi:hypothetical protein